MREIAIDSAPMCSYTSPCLCECVCSRRKEKRVFAYRLNTQVNVCIIGIITCTSLFSLAKRRRCICRQKPAPWMPPFHVTVKGLVYEPIHIITVIMSANVNRHQLQPSDKKKIIFFISLWKNGTFWLEWARLQAKEPTNQNGVHSKCSQCKSYTHAKCEALEYI